VLDDCSDLWGRPSALLWDACTSAALALEFIFRLTILASVSSSRCRLQSAVQSVISLASGFLRVLSAFALLALWIVYLGPSLRCCRGTVEGVSSFSLKKNTYVIDLVLLL